MLNILNGGVHANNNIDIQEFMIIPSEKFSFKEGLRKSTEVYMHLKNNLDKRQIKIAEHILKEINERLNFLLNVGLDYLTLSRESGTLSGGESQRIRLASQIGSGDENKAFTKTHLLT